MTTRSISWLAVLALCLAQALAAQCSNDSCLSAIRNAPTGRNVAADCLSFLAQTAPTGISSRRTTTTTVTITKRVATLTLRRSATVTANTGPTNLTASRTEHSERHEQTEADYVVFSGERQGFLPVQALQERRVTTSSTPATLPLYASKSVSEADYSSACSWLGLSQVTRVAAQPVTTKTVTAIKTIANVTLPPFFANSTILARQNGTGTGTVTSTIYPGTKSGSGTFLRPTTLFTSRLTFSDRASSGSELSSIPRSPTVSSIKPTVHVATITPTTKKEPLWVNTTSTRSYSAGNITAAHYTNSTAALVTASVNITTPSTWLNVTASATYPIPIDSTASLYSGTATSSILAGISIGVVKTTESVKFPIYKNTTGKASWYNGTSTSFLPLGTGTGTGVVQATTATRVILTTSPVASPTTPTTTTTTSARLPFLVNTTTFWPHGTAPTVPATVRGTGAGAGIWVTGTGYHNTSTSTPTPTSTSTTRSSASPTQTEDLTCGETSTPFLLRVSQPGGIFNKWFVHVIGNGLLFTSSQSQASSFSIEGTGHLCAVGYTDGNGRPRIAAVGGAGASEGDGSGGRPVWILRQETLKAYGEDYKALECTRDGGLNCAPANSTSGEVESRWVGCGLQLSLGRDVDVGFGGVKCTAVSLEIVVES